MRLRRASLESGFSLLEIAVVVLILSVIAGVLIVTLGGAPDMARREKTEAILKILAEGCSRYRWHFQEYPPAGNGESSVLHSALGRPFERRVQDDPPVVQTVGPLVSFRPDWLKSGRSDPDPPSEILDAWDRPLRYERPTPDRFVLRSAGEDGEWGTDDDLVAGSEP